MGKKQNSNVVPMSAGNALPKAVAGLVVLGLLVVIVKHPADAATWTKALATWVEAVVDGMAAFFQQLAD